jgi:hypothetical protein
MCEFAKSLLAKSLLAAELYIDWQHIKSACFESNNAVDSVDLFDIEAYALGLSASTTAADSVAHAHAARLFPALARATAAAEKGRVSAESESCLQAVARLRRTRAQFADTDAGLLRRAGAATSGVAELRASFGAAPVEAGASFGAAPAEARAGFDVWRICVLGDFLAEWLCLLGFEAQREMRDRLRCAAADALAAGPVARCTAACLGGTPISLAIAVAPMP